MGKITGGGHRPSHHYGGVYMLDDHINNFPRETRHDVHFSSTNTFLSNILLERKTPKWTPFFHLLDSSKMINSKIENSWLEQSDNFILKIRLNESLLIGQHFGIMYKSWIQSL